ncbi:MAG: type II toxin-antitoxin system RelE/ParE family toxin [Streptococcaceae bacterium]|jgi:plasmid stabilization system protein ParE|nr:type II toxin-antitoxin system RelE/ParE family toxin [Streptococcaceae bacterium]
MAFPSDFSERAKTEYLQALSYYSQYSESVANRFYLDFELALHNITVFPDSWPILDAERGIYRYVMTGQPYVIYYRFDFSLKHVVVLSVFNTYRNPEDFWLD